MTRDETIARVRELIKQRDDIDTELDTLLVAGPRPLTVRDRSTLDWPKRKQKRKQSACSICGKTGHNVMTCPNGRGLHPNNPRDEKPEKTHEPDMSGGTKGAKIKRLLSEGHDDDFIASETLSSPRVVAFIRKQMQSRGEL